MAGSAERIVASECTPLCSRRQRSGVAENPGQYGGNEAFHRSIGYAPGIRNPCGMLKRVILIARITMGAFTVCVKRAASTSARRGTFVRYERKGEMPQQRRQGTIRNAGTGGILALLIGMLTVLAACAGPGGDGLSTISAASTVGGTLTTATASGTRAASTGTTGTTASSTVAAAGGSSVASPNGAGSAVARTPAAMGSAVSVGSQTAGAGSATSGTRPATSGSTTPGVASATTRAVTTGGSATTGSATAAGAGTATRAGSATASRAAGTAGATGAVGTTTASTGSATIPPPTGGTEYVKGTNPIIDTILQGASEGLNSSSETVTVTSSKSYTSTSSAADVVAAYQKQMPTLGWTPEQNQAANGGITTLVYSRDNQTNAALLLVVDLAQVGQKGCLVITALAKPK